MINGGICLYLTPNEFLMFERLMSRFDEQINIGKIKWDFIIYLDIKDSVDWNLTKKSRCEILDFFNNILKKFNNKNINIISIIDKVDIYGCVSARRDFFKTTYDYYIWVDSDIVFKNDFLSYYEKVIIDYIDRDVIITPQILKKWDSSWDCLVNKKFLNKDFNFHKTVDVKLEIDNINEEVYVKEIDNSLFRFKYKWGGGIMTCFSKNAINKVGGIPDSFYHYGHEDTWLMMIFGCLNKKKQPIQLVTINNIADEDYKNRIAWKPDEIILNNRKSRNNYIVTHNDLITELTNKIDINMDTRLNISLLVALKNNLDYSKNFYNTTRSIYPFVEICFVSYGSTDGTHEWLDSLVNDSNVKIFHSPETKTFSDTFNKATMLATKDYIAYLHNDIVIGTNFIENLEKHLKPKRVVGYTTIEPPIFGTHNRVGKVLCDFGTDLQTFNMKQFRLHTKSLQKQHEDVLEKGVVFFLSMNRKELIQLGGMDNLFNPAFCEDDDLIKRLRMSGFELITSRDAIVYHFVSKTSRFSDEFKYKTKQWEQQSGKNFIRKWKVQPNINLDEVFNIGLIVPKNINLNNLEPFFTTIYTDSDITDYISTEQPTTKFVLSDKFKPLDAQMNNNILVSFDEHIDINTIFETLTNIPYIVNQIDEIGTYVVEGVKINIRKIVDYSNELIKKEML